MGGEDPLEEGMATHSSILAWRIHVDRRAWWATVHAATELDTTGATRHTHATVCHIHIEWLLVLSDMKQSGEEGENVKLAAVF